MRRRRTEPCRASRAARRRRSRCRPRVAAPGAESWQLPSPKAPASRRSRPRATVGSCRASRRTARATPAGHDRRTVATELLVPGAPAALTRCGTSSIHTRSPAAGTGERGGSGLARGLLRRTSANGAAGHVRIRVRVVAGGTGLVARDDTFDPVEEEAQREPEVGVLPVHVVRGEGSAVEGRGERGKPGRIDQPRQDGRVVVRLGVHDEIGGESRPSDDMEPRRSARPAP